MSKLDELLRELCPDGVEYKKLVDAVSIERGKRVVRSQLSISGKYPVYQNSLTPLGYHTDYNYNANTTFIIVAGAAGEIGFSDKAFWAADDCFAIVCPEGVLNRYIYHLLLNNQNQLVSKVRKASIPRLSRSAIENLVIPIPPLDVQREIVRILDDYTENVTELQRQLTAELTARKIQYSFYRDYLLAMKPQWNHVKIIDMLSQPITDGPHTTPQFVQKGVPFISVDSIWDGKIHFEKMRGYITEAFDEECCKKYKPQKNDVYMVKSGSTTGKVAFVDTDIRFNIWSPLAAMRVNEQNSARFLFYLLQTEKVQKQVKAKASHGSQPNLGMRELEQFEVDVPSLDVQKRIVNVLDNFEKICSDLNIGLPAEIEARQKQYEYYRDKLLTFAETGNTILSRAEQSRAEQSRAEQSRALIKLLQYVYGCVWLELGDVIVSLNTGLNPRKFFKLNTEDATNYYITIREMKDGKIVPSEKTDRMNDEARKLCNYRSNLEVGDVLFSGTGTIGETAVIEKEPSNWNIKEGVYAIKPNQTMIQPMYLRYILMTDFIKKEYMKKAAGGTVQSVPMGELKKIRIPVPSLQEQNRIVGVLKQLDDLCNDLTSGLPAEIEARQRQYEHYRDKLLSFKELT